MSRKLYSHHQAKIEPLTTGATTQRERKIKIILSITNDFTRKQLESFSTKDIKRILSKYKYGK